MKEVQVAVGVATILMIILENSYQSFVQTAVDHFQAERPQAKTAFEVVSSGPETTGDDISLSSLKVFLESGGTCSKSMFFFLAIFAALKLLERFPFETAMEIPGFL